MYRLRTEDGIEVRKLYIRLVDKSVECEEIQFLLSVYGAIDEIKIFGKNINSGWKMRNRGFLTFSKGCDASCALINRKKFSELFVLSPADTWNQPGYDRDDNGSKSCESQEEFDSKLLTLLNDDCLLHVLTFLDILDVIVLRKVCNKFSELGQVHFKSIKRLNFGSIKSKKKLTLHESRLVLETVGRNITTASINSEKFYNQRVLSFLPKYLTNLKHLKMTGFKLESKSFWDQMASILKNLKSLDLSDNSEINENFLKSFKKTPSSLKHLNVANCNINGKFLKFIASIESLNLSGCRYVNGKQMIEFVEKGQKLKSLNISKCPNFFGKDVNELLKKLPQLKVLSLNNYYIDEETSRFVIPSINPLMNLKELTIQNINYPPCDQLLRTINLDNCIEVLNISYGYLTLTSVYAISTMKRLKKLIMNFKNSVPEDFVDYLMELENLEEVHVSCCSYILPANVLRLLNLPKMKFLDISRCYGFTNDFIDEALERLKEIKREHVFKIILGQTDIDKNVLDALKGSAEILQIKWETTKDAEHDYDIDEENNKSENLNQEEYFSIDGEF